MNKKFTVLVGLLMAVAVTGYSVSGTYAKYTEEFNGASSSASVAKWAVKLTQGATELTNGYTFNLMETSTNASLTDGANTKLLAPGSTGHFTIKVQNNSDVNAAVKAIFTLTDDSAAVPLVFSTTETGTYGALSTMDLDETDGKNVIKGNGAEKEITIYWKWDPASTDAADTALGKASATAAAVPDTGARTFVKVNANITVSQTTVVPVETTGA